MNIKYIMLYLLIINITSFTLFLADKQKSKKNKWRIKESTLHTVSFMGGAIGSIAAMILFHHKTKKTKFIIITIIALIINAIMAYELLINIFDGGISVILK
ncbi:MAG: DUF1294 domain-containing protein [Tissierellia bacterium]|nr:DUF1294 domain-containing protein [Tissierellia bacterium]